jgi:hypothetical protein
MADLFFERPARRLSLADLATRLETAGKAIERRLAAPPDNEWNRNQIRHIVGIERWSQQRVRVALGSPLVMDEYDDYRPAANLPWEQMRTTFQDTRRETVALIRELERAGIPTGTKVPHNQFGDLSVGGWFQYMNNHANRESRYLRQ